MNFHKLRLALVVLTIAAITLLVGCGGKGTTENTLPPLPEFIPGSVTSEERSDAINEINAYYSTVSDLLNRDSLVLAELKSLSAIVYSEITRSGDVTGWFKDGTKIVVMTGLDRSYLTSPSLTSSNPLSQANRGLPHGKKAVLINSFEPARDDATSEVETLLSQKGYEVSCLDGSIEEFRNLRNVSLLLVHAHGIRDTDKDRNMKFWYATSTKPTPELDLFYKNEIEKGTIAYGSGEVFQINGSYDTESRYIISTDFLKDAGITFSPNSTWISQSCSSAGSEIVNFAIDNYPIACYMGWSNKQDTNDSTDTTRLLFDRLLGLNVFMPKSEPFPPKTFEQAQVELDTTTRTSIPLSFGQSQVPSSPRAEFVIFTSKGTDSKTIIPSIQNTLTNISNNTLTINGFFGPQSGSGTVTLNGSILIVKSWSPNSIVVELPGESDGVLVVRSLGAASATGYLFSNNFQFQAISIKINPFSAVMSPNETKSFTSQIVSGALPTGSKYRWTVIGNGRINGASSVTTTNSSIIYKAPSTNGSEIIRLDLLDSSSNVIAQASSFITVGTEPQISFEISGSWDPAKTPANGVYSYQGGEGARFSPEPGKEAIFFAYNIGDVDETVGVLLTIMVSSGQPLIFPSSYSLGQIGQPLVSGDFQLTLATNQQNPDDPNSEQFKVGSTGTLNIVNVVNLGSGRKRVQYNFEVSNGQGGTITGSGVQVYTGT
ncbi:MAG: hypothetical protein KF824_11785 [Fimbriimonadaceae bacterium]|nr:MAG: hypothetical protein KF824_11785 [Fimbriimonadaceae bacterium]